MSKTGLIIKREYLTRVRKKSFIIMTILGPIIFAALFAIPIWLATRDSNEVKNITVVDESGLFRGTFEDEKGLHFDYLDATLNEAKTSIKQNGSFGLLYIPDLQLDNPSGITFYSESSAGIELKERIERVLEQKIENMKLEESQIDKATLDALRTNVNLNEISLAGGEEKSANTGIYTGIGYLASFMIYMFIFIYGAQIMRGVLEEKTSRIVEVIISSVKPTQLMIGKTIGIAAVGLTQFIIWIVLTSLIYSVGLSMIGLDAESIAQINQMPSAEGADFSSTQVKIAQASGELGSLNVPLMVGGFLFYFLGGYLLYGAMFAAIGAASDSETDTQQFMAPVSMPLVLGFVVAITAVLKDPNGSTAFWFSMVPFTSPTVMLMRLPFGVPMWELATSMVLLVLGFLLMTWLAGRIYRIGILMHGSKVNYKTIGKWLMMR
ncbi:ABC transporter permease [Cesiribacter sp. SM1]|uniref:ABC transporter permease n=1 Tax=Cesiribacter sp. SM1 TaxID=2861196 RepID=UPI001CD486FE|nr:ABC transporter permease [Cesiribacter sp. SM1]